MIAGLASLTKVIYIIVVLVLYFYFLEITLIKCAYSPASLSILPPGDFLETTIRYGYAPQLSGAVYGTALAWPL